VPEIGKKLYELKNFGIKDLEVVDGIGANAKMNEFQAAMGICNLRHIGEEIEKRKRVYEQYQEELRGVKGLKLPLIADNVSSNYAYYPIVVEAGYGRTRDDLYEKLLTENIYSRKYFYPLVSEYQCYAGRFDANQTPVALKISQSVLTLPMYADLTEQQVSRICQVIREFAKVEK